MKRVGPYAIESVLGIGGGGTVYAGRAPDGTEVAIKVPDLGALRSDWLLQEASVAARLRHPNIVALLESGRLDDGRPYLVLEHVPGKSLEFAGRSMSTDEIVRVGAELLGALGYAHDAGVLHLDVSPGNVLIHDDERSAHLTDFGLSVPRDPTGSRVRNVVVAGTPGYLSPEQAIGAGGLGPRTDIYGAGAVLYRLISGQAPHIGGDSTEIIHRTLHMTAEPLRPRAGITLSAEACALVNRMLSRGPEDRPATAFAALREWRRHTQSKSLTTVDPHQPTPAAPIQRLGTIETEVRAEPTRPARPTRLVEAEILQDDPIYGREELIRAVVDDLFAEDAAIVALQGPAGIGKSTVIDGVARALNAADVAVARVQGRRGSACAPFEPLASLALAMVDPDDRRRPWASAERLARELDEAGVPARARDALVRGLLGAGQRADIGNVSFEVFGAIQALRPRRPLVLVVDDADGLDAASRGVLESLPDARLGVLLVGEAVSGRKTHEVPPLDPIAASRIHGSATRERIPAQLVLTRWCDGHSLRERLATLPTAQLEMLRVAAVFEGDVPARALISVASDRLGETVDDAALQSLVDARVLMPVKYSCARTERWLRWGSEAAREAVRVDHQRLYRDVALWLSRESFDGSPGVQARVSELAERGGLTRLAAFAAAEAGRRAADSGDPDAPAFLQRALDLEAPYGSIDRPELAVRLAEIDIRQGSREHAMACLEDALSELVRARRPVLHARALRFRASALGDNGETREAIRCLRAALTIISRDGDPMEMALVLSSLGWQLGYVAGDNEQGLAYGKLALKVASRIDVPRFRAHLCGRVGANQLRAGDWNGQLGTNLTDLGLSIIAEDLYGIIRAHINIGVCYTNRGLLALARAHTEESARLAKQHGALAAGMIAENNLATIAADQERWDDVFVHAEASITLAKRRGAQTVAETHMALARAHHARGELEARDAEIDAVHERAKGAEAGLAARVRAVFSDRTTADEALTSVLDAGIGDPYERATTHLARAIVRDDADERRDAVAVLEQLGANVALEEKRWSPRG